MVFTLDVSGSMNGQPIEQSKSAIQYALEHMRPDDTFQIVQFAGERAADVASDPLPATRENVRAGARYIEADPAGGGTMMLEGIRASLDFPHDESRLRFVSFLTDGYIGNEAEILGEVQRSLGAARMFSFGVGSSQPLPARRPGHRWPRRGRVPRPERRRDEVMAVLLRPHPPAGADGRADRLGRPAATEVFPARLPDLFVGRPVILTGKFLGAVGDVAVRGRLGSEAVSYTTGAARDSQQPALRSLWARLRIEDFARRQTLSGDANGDLAGAIRATALEHGLMSAYTSFVAVDSCERTAGERNDRASSRARAERRALRRDGDRRALTAHSKRSCAGG